MRIFKRVNRARSFGLKDGILKVILSIWELKIVSVDKGFCGFYWEFKYEFPVDVLPANDFQRSEYERHCHVFS